MRKKHLILSLLFFVIILGISTKNVFASENVLLVTNDEIMSGSTIKSVIENVSNNELDVTNLTFGNNLSFNQAVEKMGGLDAQFESVIIQDSFKNINASNDIVSAVNRLHAKNGNKEDARYLMSTPWKNGTETERDEIVVKCEKAVSDMSQTLHNTALINLYDQLLEAQKQNLTVLNGGKLTNNGELLVGCMYYRYLTGDLIGNLQSYSGVTEADVRLIVKIANEVNIEDVSREKNEDVGIANDEGSSNGGEFEQYNNENADTQNKTTKTTKKTEGSGEYQSLKIIPFKCDREPRLSFVKSDPKYLYVKITDAGGIRQDGKYAPKVYLGKKADSNKEIKDLKRTKLSEEEYQVGIPSKYIKNTNTDFYITASDNYVYKNVIKEYFTARTINATAGSGANSENASVMYYSIDRAPVVIPATMIDQKNKIGFYAKDDSGVGKVSVRTLSKNSKYDVLGEWNGAQKAKWQYYTKTMSNIKYGLSKLTMITSFFANRSWVGKNPRVQGKNGVYAIAISAEDSNGKKSYKTLVVNTNAFSSEVETNMTEASPSIKTSNSTKKSSTKTKKTTRKTTKQSTTKSTKKTTHRRTAEILSQSRTFYYDKLNSDGKKLYESFRNHKNDMKNGVYKIDYGSSFKTSLMLGGSFSIDKCNDLANSSFPAAARGLWCDDPEFCFVKRTKDPGKNGDGKGTNDNYLALYWSFNSWYGTCNVSAEYCRYGNNYYINNCNSISEVNNLIKKVQGIRSTIVKQTKDMSDYDKIRYAHDYVVDNNVYTSTGEARCHSLYGCLVDKKGVCEANAYAMKYFLDAMDIPCIVVIGKADTKKRDDDGNIIYGAHAWNYVWLNGKWYGLDATWDDRDNPEIQEKYRYSYFLKGKDVFNQRHVPTGQIGKAFYVEYPTLSDNNYKK